MHWVFENWLLLLVGGGLAAMHVFGHGHRHKGGRKDAHHVSAQESEAPELETTGKSKESSNG